MADIKWFVTTEQDCWREKEYIESDCVTKSDLRLTGDTDQIIQEVQTLSSQRKEKQPLEYPSAGSTFKRPEGYFAGKLIQDAGLKGYRVGDAMVSEKHSGFVINVGSATAKDVRKLMNDVDVIVYNKYQVHLEPEVRLIGEFD